MNQGKYNLPYRIILTLSAIATFWINPVSFDLAIAGLADNIPQISLLPSPSLQKEPTEILTAKETELPPEVQSAVLEVAASRTSQTVSTLRIVEAQPQNWSDGCLGLAKPDRICTQVITPGWRVIVTDGRRNWIYRTDDLGNLIELEEAPQ
ncbi:MAG: hypothetical protein SVX43_22770 [Cyanobacteriota bacterium]|nr:hypothetical protein [Cyanobacteriota bacterium]